MYGPDTPIEEIIQDAPSLAAPEFVQLVLEVSGSCDDEAPEVKAEEAPKIVDEVRADYAKAPVPDKGANEPEKRGFDP